MSIFQKTLESKILGKPMNLSFYCPSGYEVAELPVLYFLHGRTGDETLVRQTGMDKLADELIAAGEIKPLCIVCPSMGNSRGINSARVAREVDGKYGPVHKGRYADYLLEEVIPFAEDALRAARRREDRYIGGVSAGGYAALHLALRHQELFSRVGGHMPAIDLSYADEDECYFADEAMWLQFDPISIAAGSGACDLRVFLDDGDQDEGQFYRGCEKLYEILRQKGADVQNHVFKGHHNGEYVVSNLKTYLRFYGA